MHPPVEITFRGLAPTPAAETRIAHCIERLERAYPRIHRCNVTIELPHRSQHHGRLFHVRVELGIPETTIVVSRDRGVAHEDLHVAIADAFDAARRQLQDHARIRRGDVKQHV